MSPTETFLLEIDHLWGSFDAKHKLHLIGASALLLQTDYHRATKDSDVLEAHDFSPTAKAKLLALAGEGTPLARKHRLYIDSVAPALPFLPAAPLWHPLDALNERLVNFEVFVLDVVDVVVSKLFRFHANDRNDIDAMISRELVAHATLLERFLLAVDRFAYDARCERLPVCVARLHTVERDSFGVEPTTIELPDWIDY